MAAALAGVARVEIVAAKSQIGSGALPVSLLPSAGHRAAPDPSLRARWSKSWAQSLRELPIPVIGHIAGGALVLDLRCLEDEAGFVAQLAALRPA